MICLGNICRSPMASSVAGAMVERARLADRVTVESFGTAGYHAGESADPRADAALRRRGWPAGDHCARRLHPRDLAAADLVLCADRANLAEVRRLAGLPPGPGLPGQAAPAGLPGLPDRTGLPAGLAGQAGDKIRLLRSFDPGVVAGDDEVPDPWGGEEADFDQALELIERACRGLVTELASALR